MRFPWALCWLLLPLLCFASSAKADFDPDLTWYSMETPHFILHFHQGLAPFSQNAAQRLEAVRTLLASEFITPSEEKVHVLVSDVTDSANGSVMAWIRPTIQLFATPPESRSELNDYQDYLWNLAVHEYSHILHLGECSGVPAMVNRLFGKLWLPNGFLPRWFSEGIAVINESAYSNGGRIRSSLYDMFLRAQLLENSFYGIDDISAYPTTWPRGGIAYLHGSRFMHWIAQHHGAKSFASLIRNHGAQIIPFALNDTAQEEIGASYLELYPRWLDHLKNENQSLVKKIRSQKSTVPLRITFSGESTGEPVFLDSNSIIYLDASADRGPQLRSIKTHGTDEKKIVDLHSSGYLALSPDKKTALISQTVLHRQFYYFEDLFYINLNDQSLHQLTFGQRLSEPNYSPNGQTIVAVQRRSGGITALVLLSSAGHLQKTLYVAPQDSVLYTPCFSPDGQHIAFSEQRPSGRDIRVLNLKTLQIVDITRDRAIDLDPSYHPQGQFLLFSSDRTGIYNLYAYHLAEETTLQITNVLTGAFRPSVSPDGRQIAWVTYSSIGYDLALLPFEVSSWPAAPAVDSIRPNTTPPPLSPQKYPVQPYQPLSTLWPQYWLPVISNDPQGTSLGIFTSGSDVVGRHNWTLQTEWGVTSGAPSFLASYSARIFYPELRLGLGSFLSVGPVGPVATGLERQSFASLYVNLPFSRLSQHWSFFGGYELRYYDPFSFPTPKNHVDPKRFQAEKGLASTVSLGWGLSNVGKSPNGVSAEEGQVLGFTAKGACRETGSQFRYLSLTGNLSHYQSNPWFAHHVLALRAGGGTGWGDLGRRRIFQLGGMAIQDLSLAILWPSPNSSTALRGYRPGAFSGNSFVLGNAEYRFPITEINAGPWTLPFYFRRIYGAVTFDIGQASDKIRPRELKPAAGAEICSELLLGYNLAASLRLGYSRGFGPQGTHNYYLTMGSGF